MAQLFEGWLTQTQSFVFFSFFFSKAFSQIIFLFFLQYSIINVYTKIKLNFLFKLSHVISNFTVTEDYLNPALNNPAQSL